MSVAHMNLGAMYHFNGKLKEAKKSYLKALELKPRDSVTINNLKKLKVLMKEGDEKKDDGGLDGDDDD